MTQMEQIQDQLLELPPEKQREVLDFVAFLRQQLTSGQRRSEERFLRLHPAFGSWRGRKIDALEYERALRSEWSGIRVPYST